MEQQTSVLFILVCSFNASSRFHCNLCVVVCPSSCHDFKLNLLDLSALQKIGRELKIDLNAVLLIYMHLLRDLR